MASPLTSSNRINIPAVCRVRRGPLGATAGTGVLVAPGVILTSRYAVGDHPAAAAALTATFFEGTKKRVVDVKLLPDKYFFTAAYPEYMDYCLVACEEGPLLNVVPVHVPLTQREWTPVCEGDVVLVVQHPIVEEGGEEEGDGDDNVTGHTGNGDDKDDEGGAGLGAATEFNAVEQKRFEEVLRCRENLYYLKTNGLARTAGCPVFNDLGNLIGLQCQRHGADGEGIVNRVLSIVAVAKHMFAMKQLSVLPQQQLVGPAGFDDMWSTWFTERDITRVYTILGNFRGRETVREVTRRLCEIITQSDSALNAQEDGGAVSIILANLVVFPKDQELAELGLRALWNVSVGNSTVLHTIANENGVHTVVTIMETFLAKEEIVQFGVVMLCNMAEAGVNVFAQQNVGERLLVLLLAAVKSFKEAVVLQKFSLAMLTRLLRWQQHDGAVDSVSKATAPLSFAVRMVQQGMFEHVGYLLSRHSRGQVFLVERVLEFVAELVQDRKALELSRGSSGAADVASRGVTAQQNDVPVSVDALSTQPHYLTFHFIDILIDAMGANVGNDTIMVSGNAALWGLGNVPEYRAAILLNPQSQEVLRLSVPSLVASSR